MWISRVQSGRQPLAIKIPLKSTLRDFATTTSPPTSSTTTPSTAILLDSEDESDSSVGSNEKSPAGKDMDWDIADKGCTTDEFLNDDSGDSGDEEQNGQDVTNEFHPCAEDTFPETELGSLVATVQHIIELSNTSAKKQVTTNKQKQQWWDNRKKLDARMKEVVENLETSVLGWRKALLVAPPLDKPVQELLKKAADTLEVELMFETQDSHTESVSTGRKSSSRTKSASAKPKSKSATERKKHDKDPSPTTCINRPLLDVCLSAVPFLTDSEICQALESITGRYMELKWATTLRTVYEKCSSCTRKKVEEDTEHDNSDRQTLILALDGKLQRLPWESMPCLDTHSITRVPSLLYANILYNSSRHMLASGINSKRAFYLLNAEGDLTKTQECFEIQFKRRQGWQGLVGTRPTAEEYKQALTEHDLFVYCGHGSGEQFLKRDAVARLPKCSVALLMGCSSGFLSDEGDFEPTGMANSFLVALSPSVVGNLWDVTDGELDRLTKALLSNWLDQGLSLPIALAQARKTCQFKFLVAAAAVCYGVPVSVSSSRAR